MPPAQNTPLISNPSGRPAAELLPPAHKTQSPLGPLVGIIIIVILLGFGALYFWGAYLNKKNSVEQLPFIPEDNSTPIAQ